MTRRTRHKYPNGLIIKRIDYDDGRPKEIKQWHVDHEGVERSGKPKGADVLLIRHPDDAKKVVVVEGEKCFDVACELWPDVAIACWPGGAGNVANVNFDKLRHYDEGVILIPDGNDVGYEAMEHIGDVLFASNVTFVVWPKDGTDIADLPGDTVKEIIAANIVTFDERPYTAAAFDAWWEQVSDESFTQGEAPEPALKRTDGKGICPSIGFVEIMGPRGSGKSWIGLMIAAEALKKGRRVVYIRGEGSLASLLERLVLLDASKEILKDDGSFRSVRDFGAFIDSHEGWPDVLIIDPAASTGAATNDAAEAEMWLSKAVRPFTDDGLVVSIDHTAKRLNADVMTIDSRGSSAKTAHADFALFVHAYSGSGTGTYKTTWTRDRSGYLHLLVAKGDRDGWYDADEEEGNRIAIVRGSHSEEFGFQLVIEPPVLQSGSHEEMIIEYVRSNPECSQAKVVANAGVPQKKAVGLLTHLVDTKKLVPIDGSRGAKLFRVAPAGWDEL